MTKYLSLLLPACLIAGLFTACGGSTPTASLPTVDPGTGATTVEPISTEIVRSTQSASQTPEPLPTMTRVPVIPDEPLLLYSLSAGELAINISFTVPRGVGLLGIESGTNLMPANYMEEQDFFLGTPFSWSPDGTRFVYASTQNGSTQLYILYADGTNRSQLTAVGENDSPAWSPDGSRIAFVSRQGEETSIQMINPDGSGLTCLTCGIDGSEVSPTWSPDSLSLAFTALSGPAPVTILNLATLKTHTASSPELKASDPVFSPDGEWFAFVCESRICINTPSGQVLWTIFADTGVNIQPTISPDGTQIAFISNRDGDFELYVINSDKTGLRQLTSTPYAEMHPSWSPDGQWIAFTSAMIFQESFTNFDLYLIQPDGQGSTRLTNLPTNEFFPLWSPKE